MLHSMCNARVCTWWHARWCHDGGQEGPWWPWWPSMQSMAGCGWRACRASGGHGATCSEGASANEGNRGDESLDESESGPDQPLHNHMFDACFGDFSTSCTLNSKSLLGSHAGPLKNRRSGKRSTNDNQGVTVIALTIFPRQTQVSGRKPPHIVRAFGMLRVGGRGLGPRRKVTGFICGVDCPKLAKTVRLASKGLQPCVRTRKGLPPTLVPFWELRRPPRADRVVATSDTPFQ